MKVIKKDVVIQLDSAELEILRKILHLFDEAANIQFRAGDVSGMMIRAGFSSLGELEPAQSLSEELLEV